MAQPVRQQAGGDDHAAAYPFAQFEHLAGKQPRRDCRYDQLKQINDDRAVGADVGEPVLDRDVDGEYYEREQRQHPGLRQCRRPDVGHRLHGPYTTASRHDTAEKTASTLSSIES